MVRRIRPLVGRASLAVSVMDILKLPLAPRKYGKLSARALRTQRTTNTLGIAQPTRVGSGIAAGADMLRRLLARSPSLARLKSGFVGHRVLPESFFLNSGAMLFSYQCAGWQCLLLSGRGPIVVERHRGR